MSIQTVNPATEQVISTYNLLGNAQAHQLINKAQERFSLWRKTPFSLRRAHMLKLAQCLRLKQDEYARLMAQEMGKPITAGKAEIEKCAWVCEHYAEQSEAYLRPQFIQTDMQKSMVCYQPLGVVLGIMPWNFPFWQVFRFAVPTIMAGNVVVLKHASISAGTGFAIASLFLDAGFSEHVFQHLLIDKDTVASVIADEKIIAVTLTGSDETGRIVAANAGSHLKKSMLELGGSDPYIVLADADLALAARCIVASRLNNCGQVCIAAKRAIVVAEVAERLIVHLIEEMNQYKVGDPLDSATMMGPMARADLRTTLHHQVVDSIAKGARLRMGGEKSPGVGFYYPPTLLTAVRPGMPAFDEELFGPVVAVITASSEADAIRLANQTCYGLAAAVFTQDLARGEEIAMHEIEAGACFVNAMVSSDPRLPFGGIKQSGYGRELSREGILEFVNTKTVAING